MREEGKLFRDDIKTVNAVPLKLTQHFRWDRKV